MSINIEFISTLIGLVLSLMIFSYLIGDNPLFRIAMYLFVGISSGYAAAVVWHYVLVPQLFSGNTNFVLLVVPLILSASLLAKPLPRIAWIGNFAMAFLVGVGAAAAIGGALIGTLLPQAQATMDAFSAARGNPNIIARLFEGGIMLLGTVFTLGSFHFSASRAQDGTVKQNRIFDGIAWIGRIFIAITFGVLFAGVYMAALTAMIERISAFINLARQFLGS